MLQRYPLPAYLALRTALLVGVAVVLWALGVRGLLAIILALLVSSVISLFTLGRYRDAVSGNLDRRISRTRERLDRAAASEDE
ncbi:uncharacterized protein DUF4229 [Motilibacter rhizosphaerae]|uniref:Uncharacterized protein DUF4229 n=1 Tax=Motilibacter rhizosphaerae TaxID=598652 RepID=A0A4Q7NAY4_9ACTN|nr:DUF4229 domain-containing protein [Motilibacter rhizosphaerae]RZS79041.1 uncharacterized protein DUF4229 [Motilibacter rhizosphaerae]